MGRDRAAYMRDYRARKKVKVVDLTTTEGRIGASFDIVKADLRIAELEEEVRHLKAELAKRPSVGAITMKPRDDLKMTDAWAHSRPVPKKR
jgi:hypothetical protein